MMNLRIKTFAVALLLSATSLAAQNTQVPYLEDPVAIHADGVAIDTGEHGGFAGSLVHDYDNDGLRDLLVTSFDGYVRFCRNVGTPTEPKYTDKGLIQVDGEPLKFHNW